MVETQCVYPREIIQTSSLGRLQKNSLGYNDCLYVASVLQRRIRKPPTDNITFPQNYFLTSEQMFLQYF